jgi:YbbR domain-containing protein
MKSKINLTDNLFLKILSVLIAILIWLVVMNINDAEKTKSFPVPVELVNTEVITNNGKVFRVLEGSEFVTVKVRARKSIIDELDRTDFILTADMQKDLKYDRMVGITVECKNKSINIDENVTLSRSNVEVSIEDSATEQFQVHVRHTGEPNNGLVVGSMVPEQTIIKITGPVSLVEKIKIVEAMVDITGIPGMTVKTCELKLYDAAGGIIDNTYLKYVGKNDGIDVTVSMLNTKTVPLKFNYTGNPAENYAVKEVSYKPETVEIAGSAEVLSKIFRWEIPAEAVDVSGIDEELQLVVDLAQYLPSGVILKNGEESSALVIVEVEYIEPEEEAEEEEEETSKPSSGETSKPSKDETTKPSTEETNKPASKPSDKEDTDKDSENTNTQTPPSTETEGSEGSESGSSETSKGEGDKTQNNEAGSGENGKTESNS